MVCGSDGRDYTSLCHLEKESCTKQINISLVYSGSCDPCKDVWCSDDRTCKVDSSRAASCACVAPGACIDIVTPVRRLAVVSLTYFIECYFHHKKTFPYITLDTCVPQVCASNG